MPNFDQAEIERDFTVKSRHEAMTVHNGKEAFWHGKKEADNPHKEETPDWHLWRSGWMWVQVQAWEAQDEWDYHQELEREAQ